LEPRKTDRYDGCYNCSKRKRVECFKDPEKPVRIRGDGPCDDGHVLMASFQYARSAEEAYNEFNGKNRSVT